MFLYLKLRHFSKINKFNKKINKKKIKLKFKINLFSNFKIQNKKLKFLKFKKMKLIKLN